MCSSDLVKNENNDIVEISFYKDGINDGVSYTYYLNGDLKSVSTYRKCFGEYKIRISVSL